MGTGASTGKGVKETHSDHTIVSLDQVHQRLRIFQHRGNGDVLVLVDDDLDVIKGIKLSEWEQTKVNVHQKEYFKNIKVDVMLPGQNVNVIHAPETEPLPPASKVILPAISSPSTRKKSLTADSDPLLAPRSGHFLEPLASPSHRDHSLLPSKESSHAIDDRMKATLSTLKAAAVLENSGAHSTSMSFDAVDPKKSGGAAQTLFGDNAPSARYRRKPGIARRFQPRPYFPQKQHENNSKTLRELQMSQSFSQDLGSTDKSGIVGGGIIHQHPGHMSNSSSSHFNHTFMSSMSNSESSSLNSSSAFHHHVHAKRVPCAYCGQVFLGSMAAEAVQDHAMLCAARQPLKRDFAQIDSLIRNEIDEMDTLEHCDLLDLRETFPRLAAELEDIIRRILDCAAQ